MHKSLLLLALVAAPLSAALLPGCVVAAVGTGVVVGEIMFEDNTFIGQLNSESGRAWAQTKTTLSKRSSQPIDVDEARRKIVADIEGAQVTASIETYDLNVSTLRVSAKRYGFPDNEIARMMFDRISEDIYRAQ
jgi:hypothetical protein